MLAPSSTLFSRLTLGTAQLGMRYGIANDSGMPTEKEARAILEAAWGAGITCFDTARAYGEAERRIGEWCAATGQRPAVVSKIPALAAGTNGPATVCTAVDQTCAMLGTGTVAGMMMHRSADLLVPGVADALQDLRGAGRIGAFGVSVYTVDEARAAMRVQGVSLLQIPMSIFDWRAADSGIAADAADRGIAVFARSIYCQGLLFLDPENLPSHVAGARATLQRLHSIASEARLDLQTLALGALQGIPGLTSIIIGAESVNQVSASVAAARHKTSPDLVRAIRAATADLSPSITDPRTWPR